jgi:hypothetical protein
VSKYSLVNKKIRKTVYLGLLLILFCRINGLAQSDVDTAVKKVEIIVQDPAQDSIESPLEEYSPIEQETEKNTVEYFDQKYLYPLTDSVQKRALPDSVAKKMQQDEDFWYANYAFEKEKEKELKRKTSITEQTWFKTLMWFIIIGGFAVALMLYLSDSNVGLFRKKVSVFQDEKHEEETENIFEINYKVRIDKAVKAGNYRLAVRLMFLQMLKTMAGKKLIQYKQDHTNFDYLLQLRNTTHYNDFFRITRDYEYTWYGNFPVNEKEWDLIKTDFEKFDNTLAHR